MRGKKGVPHRDPDDPPRRRANRRPGHGNWVSDRPPICGVVGRDSGAVRLTVAHHADAATLRTVVRRANWPMVTVYTDEWQGYGRLPEIGRYRSAVCHVAGDWARDDDGDGVREVHCNTEEIWTLLRSFPRPFRGVNKEYPHQYTAIFQWGYNIIKRVTGEFIRSLLGVRDPTS